MKNVKKILAMIIAVVLVLCCVGCSGKNNTNELKTVTEGKLTMVCNAEFPPYEFYEEGKVVGIDAEVAGLIAEKIGLELEIVDVEFDSVIPGVQSGKYDMGMSGITVTEDRLKKVNFSTSYAKGVQVVIIPENSDIKTLDDLSGKMIGVQQGTTGDIYASDDFGEEHVTRYLNGALAVEGLKNGKVDCIILDNEPSKAYVAANTGLKIFETAYADEDYAICLAKENEALLEKVDGALKELIADGSLQKVVDKYISAK